MRYLDKSKYERYNTEIDLEIIKQSMIERSKTLLQEYLKNNPLFSYAKYKDGRYYTVTQEKQQQLTKKLFSATTKKMNKKEFTLTWNDTGNTNEKWTLEELTQLSDEIEAYVDPLVLKQQQIEVAIRDVATLKELESIEINYEY